MLAKEPHLSHFNLKIDEVQASEQVMNALLECTVESSLHLPDMATLRVHDSEFKWLDADTFREGKSILIKGGDEKSPLVTLFEGEVTGMDLDLAAHGVPTIVVRCLDRSHRLHRGRHNRSFVQMTDSDIVGKVGKEAGFTVHAENTPQVHNWIFQNNQTNWEFLTDRANRNGFRLYVQGKNDLHFRKVEDKEEKPAKLDWGSNLRSFRPRVSAGPQVDEVVVRGWDPAKKTAIVGKAKKPAGVPQKTGNPAGGEAAKKAFGSAKMVVVDKPVHSQRDAEDLARSICDTIGGGYLEAEGLCYGMPKLRPGKYIQIKNIGKRFSGKYFVTSTTHTYTPAEGYSTILSCSGKQPTTLLSILEGSKDVARAPLGGNIVVGIVTDNKDPEKMGRVKVKYPSLTEDHASYWARLVSPMAGKGRGLFILPEVDDEVLVAFEHGDIHRPYVIGMLWNGKDGIPEAEVHGGGGVVDRRVFYSRIGHKVSINDKDGKGDITLQTKGGHHVVLDDETKTVVVQSNHGHKVEISDDSNEITITDGMMNNTIVISSPGNSIEVSSLGNLSLKAKGRVQIQGLLGVEVTTPTILDLKGGGAVVVQGGTVKIN